MSSKRFPRDVAVGIQACGADRRTHALPISVMPSGCLPALTQEHDGVMVPDSALILHGVWMRVT